MGLSGISIWQLLIVLAIVVMLFGTKRLRNMGIHLFGIRPLGIFEEKRLGSIVEGLGK